MKNMNHKYMVTVGWDDFDGYDANCLVCRAIRKAETEGRNPTNSEIRRAVSEAHKTNTAPGIAQPQLESILSSKDQLIVKLNQIDAVEESVIDWSRIPGVNFN